MSRSLILVGLVVMVFSLSSCAQRAKKFQEESGRKNLVVNVNADGNILLSESFQMRFIEWRSDCSFNDLGYVVMDTKESRSFHLPDNRNYEILFSYVEEGRLGGYLAEKNYYVTFKIRNPQVYEMDFDKDSSGFIFKTYKRNDSKSARAKYKAVPYSSMCANYKKPKAAT